MINIAIYTVFVSTGRGDNSNVPFVFYTFFRSHYRNEILVEAGFAIGSCYVHNTSCPLSREIARHAYSLNHGRSVL